VDVRKAVIIMKQRQWLCKKHWRNTWTKKLCKLL